MNVFSVLKRLCVNTPTRSPRPSRRRLGVELLEARVVLSADCFAPAPMALPAPPATDGVQVQDVSHSGWGKTVPQGLASSPLGVAGMSGHDQSGQESASRSFTLPPAVPQGLASSPLGLSGGTVRWSETTVT